MAETAATSAAAVRGGGGADECALWFRVVRWTAAFGLAVLMLVGYTLMSTWNIDRFTDGHATIALWTRADRVLPTIPEAIWLYVIYYVLVMMPMFAVRRVRQLVEVLSAYLLVTVVAWVVFALWPVRMEYPPVACAGVSCQVLMRLWAMDMGVNVMPSLHAGHSVLAAAVFITYRNRAWPLVTAGATAVCIAAVLTRQHYVLDIPAGIALAILGWAVVRRVVGVVWPVERLL
jgi:hypothetical protein